MSTIKIEDIPNIPIGTVIKTKRYAFLPKLLSPNKEYVVIDKSLNAFNNNEMIVIHDDAGLPYSIYGLIDQFEIVDSSSDDAFIGSLYV